MLKWLEIMCVFKQRTLAHRLNSMKLIDKMAGK